MGMSSVHPLTDHFLADLALDTCPRAVSRRRWTDELSVPTWTPLVHLCAVSVSRGLSRVSRLMVLHHSLCPFWTPARAVYSGFVMARVPLCKLFQLHT